MDVNIIPELAKRHSLRKDYTGVLTFVSSDTKRAYTCLYQQDERGASPLEFMKFIDVGPRISIESFLYNEDEELLIYSGDIFENLYHYRGGNSIFSKRDDEVVSILDKVYKIVGHRNKLNVLFIDRKELKNLDNFN